MISKRPDTYIRADHVPGPRQGEWTYSHYAALPDDGQRYEILNGVLYMTPAPGWFHQEIDGLIGTYLNIYVKFTGLGKVLVAACDVELGPKTVLQPDVLVVLNDNTQVVKLTEEVNRVIGAPDLVVEIASPGTKKMDHTKKRAAYARAGVREYWLVNPTERNVEVLTLEGSLYQSLGIFSGEDLVLTKVVPHFPVQVKQFFA